MKSKMSIYKFLKPFVFKHKVILLRIFIYLVLISIMSTIPVDIMRKIIDEGFGRKDLTLIVQLVMIMLGLNILKSIFTMLMNNFAIVISQSVIKDIRKNIFSKLLYMPFSFYSRKESVYVSSRINEINNINDLFSINFFNILISFFTFFFYVYFLGRISTKLLIVSLFPVPILFFIVKIYTGRVNKLTNELLEADSVQRTKVSERIRGVEYIQSVSAEEDEFSVLTEGDNEVINRRITQSKNMTVFSQIIALFSVFIPVTVYIFGGWLFVNDQISIGGIIAFSTNVSHLYSPFLGIASSMVTIKPAIESLRRVIDFFYGEEDKELLKKNASYDELFFDLPLKQIIFDQVSYSYQGKRQLFDNLSFVINRGDIFLLKGKNGSGKTTVIRLLLGILNPNSGNIKFNGADVREIELSAIRKRISTVDQRIFLFNDTVENNITYATNEKYDKKIYNQIIESLNIDKMIETLDDGERTLIGENGNKLSGGQVQKIAIARALLNNSDVIIFDETNANIDIETRDWLKQYILSIKDDKIIIIVDHSNDYDDIADIRLFMG